MPTQGAEMMFEEVGGFTVASVPALLLSPATLMESSAQGHPKHLAKFPKARWSQTRSIHQQLQPISKPQDPYSQEHNKNRSSNKHIASDSRNFLGVSASPPILLQSSPSHEIPLGWHSCSLQFLGSFTKTPYHHHHTGEEQAGRGRSVQCHCYFCM